MTRARPSSPYLAPAFYDRALAEGRHRDIVGGRWDETGRIQMRILREAGLAPHHHLLDIGAGALRLGCKAVEYLEPGHYWATDASRALMLRGREAELADPSRLPEDHLIEDAEFALPGVPDTITHAICFAVFTHLPRDVVAQGLARIRQRLPRLRRLMFTVFLAPETAAAGPFRQPDGVVTHPDRPPYHLSRDEAARLTRAAGFEPVFRDRMLPRGQSLIEAVPA
ncbi:MAG: class I SAM-dependent methyltransferase [Rhodobacteraceae bacterium]|nr:MAG: class I SAM-dependent methyltransferase [Paracoccaceae bacterium]